MTITIKAFKKVAEIGLMPSESVPRHGIDVFLSIGKKYIWLSVYLPDFGRGEVE